MNLKLLGGQGTRAEAWGQSHHSRKCRGLGPSQNACWGRTCVVKFPGVVSQLLSMPVRKSPGFAPWCAVPGGAVAPLGAVPGVASPGWFKSWRWKSRAVQSQRCHAYGLRKLRTRAVGGRECVGEKPPRAAERRYRQTDVDRSMRCSSLTLKREEYLMIENKYIVSARNILL